jgi:hypothetical protein
MTFRFSSLSAGIGRVVGPGGRTNGFDRSLPPRITRPVGPRSRTGAHRCHYQFGRVISLHSQGRFPRRFLLRCHAGRVQDRRCATSRPDQRCGDDHPVLIATRQPSQLRRPLFRRSEQICTCGIAGRVHTFGMDLEAQMLTREEFASLLLVGNAPATIRPPAVIPAAHSARLIVLGYMVDIEGRLRMTTPGRIRIYAGQLAN